MPEQLYCNNEVHEEYPTRINIYESRGCTTEINTIDWLIDWSLTTLSAQIGYIVPLISMLQLKSEIYEKVNNVTCWEYTNHYNK